MITITTYLKNEKIIILKAGAILISITLLVVGIFPKSTIQYSAYGINSSPNTIIVHQIAQQISSGTNNYRVDQIEQVLQKIYMQLINATDSRKVSETFTEIKRTVALGNTGPLSQGIRKIAENLVSNGAKVDQIITNIVINIKKGPPPPSYINFAVGRYTAMLIYQPFQPIIQGAATIKKGNEPSSGTPQVDAVLSCLFNRHVGNNLSPQYISYQDDSSSNRGADYSNNNNCIKIGITNVEEIYYNNNNFVIPVIQSNAIPQEMIELTIEHLLLEIANMAGDPVARAAINEILGEVAIHPSGSVSHSIYQISQLEMNSVDVAYKIVTAISKSVASGGNVIQVIPTIVESTLHPNPNPQPSVSGSEPPVTGSRGGSVDENRSVTPTNPPPVTPTNPPPGIQLVAPSKDVPPPGTIDGGNYKDHGGGKGDGGNSISKSDGDGDGGKSKSDEIG
jgi:hypothetical protein